MGLPAALCTRNFCASAHHLNFQNPSASSRHSCPPAPNRPPPQQLHQVLKLLLQPALETPAIGLREYSCFSFTCSTPRQTHLLLRTVTSSKPYIYSYLSPQHGPGCVAECSRGGQQKKEGQDNQRPVTYPGQDAAAAGEPWVLGGQIWALTALGTQAGPQRGPQRQP